MGPFALLLPIVAAGTSDGLLELLSTGDGLVGYGVLVLLLGVGCLGVPVPEEAVLATAGYASAAGSLSVTLVYVVAVGTILGFDCLLFEIGRRTGPRVERSRLGARIRPERIAWARGFFDRRGLWAVVVARFVMGTRIPTMLLAGALGMPRGRFVLATGGAGLVSAAIPLTLGYVFSDRLARLLDLFGTLRGVMFALVGALVLTLLLVLWRLGRRGVGAPASGSVGSDAETETTEDRV